LLRPLIADWLQRTPPDGQRLLVVLDGLDEAIGWEVNRKLFPSDFPPHTKLLASAREMGLRSRHDWLNTLGWRDTQIFAPTLRPLQRSAVADILQRMGAPLDTLATDIDLLDELERISEGDPLTIRLLVEALRDEELPLARLTRLPPGLESFVRDWLEELERRGTERRAVRTLLELCAVALGPLTADDLEQLAPEPFAVSAELDQAVQAVARFIIGDGSAERGYVFSHPRLRELYHEQVLSERQRSELHQRFVAYGERWYERLREDPSTQPQVPAYVRQFWVLHLAEAQRWDLVERVLTEVGPVQGTFYQPWASLRLAAEGSYAGYLSDLEHLWRHGEANSNVGLILQCALFSASIRSLSGNLSPALLVGLVTVGTPNGRWSAEAALAHIAQMPRPQQQVQALQALLEHGCIPQPSMGEALNVARAIVDESSRARALAALAPRLPAELLPQALAATRAFADKRWRARALAALVPRLPESEQPAVWLEALDADHAIILKVSYDEALLVPHLVAEPAANLQHLQATLRMTAARTACAPARSEHPDALARFAGNYRAPASLRRCDP